jgi:hypothetical protein
MIALSLCGLAWTMGERSIGVAARLQRISLGSTCGLTDPLYECVVLINQWLTSR